MNRDDTEKMETGVTSIALFITVVGVSLGLIIALDDHLLPHPDKNVHKPVIVL